MSAVLMFIIFLLLLLVGVPIAYSLGISSLCYLLTSNIPLSLMAQKIFAGIDSFTLLCVPAFMLAGSLMNTGGITKRLFKFCNSLVGQYRGSLAMLNVLDSMFFAGISGTAIADVCSLGAIIIPSMKEEGYEDDFTVALTASTSVIGPIIPPSVPMVIAGSALYISIGKMFAGGLIPGVILGLSFLGCTAYISYKRNYPKHERYTIRQILHTLKECIWALLMQVVLFGGILGGFFTPTEAAVVTVAYALFVGIFIYKELNLKNIFSIVLTSLRSSASILALIGIANIFASILISEKIPQAIASFILSITDNKFLLILIINLILLLAGMFMETNASMLILFPVLYPVATSIGMDPVHFGVMAVINLMIGLVTPPVGICLTTAAQIGKVPFTRAVKANTPFLIIMFIVLLLVAYVPEVVMFIPNLLG